MQTQRYRPANRQPTPYVYMVVAKPAAIREGIALARACILRDVGPTLTGDVNTLAYAPTVARQILNNLLQYRSARTALTELEADPTACLIIASCYQTWPQRSGHLS